MVDYNELRKKFPAKDPDKRKRVAAIKAIAREYEMKKAALGGLKAPVMKKGVVFYVVIVIGLLMLGALVLSATGHGGRARISRAMLDVRKSVDNLALALGRYRYHVGEYPSTEEGLEALASTKITRKGWNGPYIRQVVKDPWGHAYVYVRNGAAENPTLYSKGPDGLAGTTDDVLPDPSLFDAPFRDTTWTQGWMPYQLRGYVLASDETMKKAIEKQVDEYLHPVIEPAGETVLTDGWEFAQAWKDTYPQVHNPPAAPYLPDSTNLVWKKVRVPHDWAISGPFVDNPEAGHTARLPWRGLGYYRRTLEVPAEAKGSFVALRFGGVMARPRVFLNGEEVGSWDYGYMSFEVDVSDKVKFGEKNELLVVADTSSHRSRWYPGAGIFREVRLVVEDMEDRMIYNSLKITTPVVTEESATVCVEYDTPFGAVSNELVIASPILWSPERPFLYQYRICDKIYRYGIRTAEFTADDGFHLNGRRYQLKGVNLHSDLGPLGMAFDREAARRQLEVMKDMGVNAIRTSHNAPDPQFLDLCDEMGFVVWDECFDKWDDTADSAADALGLEELVSRNLKQFVRRDRNHPSVVCWSSGNEIRPADEPDTWAGRPDRLYVTGTTRERCAAFRAAVLEEDRTRPVGIGCCFQSAIEKGHYADMDLTGWNYRGQYAAMRAKYPEKPTVYSESASAFSTWGDFPDRPSTTPTNYNVCTSVEIDAYDLCAAEWADIADVEFARMERDRYCAGEFVWTGIDYLGEPSPNARLNRSSFFGICDLCAMPKDRFYLYRSLWNTREATVHLLPHWNWEGREGEPVTVMCYTSGDEAELFLNGESQGRRKKVKDAGEPVGREDPGYYRVTERYRLSWDVPYEPGEIKVIAFKDGSPIGEDVRRTAYKAFGVKLTSERETLGDGELAFVKVELVDEYGTVLPLANDRVAFALEGPGAIVAVGNASTHGADAFTDVKSHPLYNGRALAVVRRKGGSGLPLKLTASVPGLRSASVTLPLP